MITAILEELANEPKTNAKLEILKRNSTNELLKDICFCATNKLLPFNIKKIPDYTPNTGTPTMHLDEAIVHLHALADRTYTGHAGIDHLKNILESVSDRDAQVVIKVVNKDLRCGVQSATVNKVWKGLIPEFPYQRCSLPKHVKLDTWPWSKGVFSQLKADGMYINANFYDDLSIELLSRSGNPMPLGQFSKIIDYMQRHMQCGTQTHGELVVKRDGVVLPREIGNGILNSIADGGEFAKDEEPLFLVWDQIPLSTALPKGKGTVSYADRYYPLKNQIASQALTDPQHVQLIESKLVFSWEEAFKHYLELIEQGLEGTIIKHPDAKWRDGTSKEQVKLKLEVDVDLEIVAFTEGNGKNAALFGSITCRTSDQLLEVNVSGFSDELRTDIFNRKDELYGTIIAVRSNNIMPPTTSNGLYSLFLPRFVEFRKDKTEADSLQQVKDQFDSAIGKTK
jgi:DNA ligase-1